MQELDLLLLSLVIFVPSLFAVGLVFFPRGTENAMRWWTLAGTALTLGLSLCAFARFKDETVDRHIGRPDKEAREATLLEFRVAEHNRAEAENKPARSDDWVSRRKWIEPFQIEYF